MSDRTPSRAEVIKAYVQSQMSELHVCLPGKVEKVDHENQTVDVQPQLKRRLQHEDGTVTFERLPVIPSVPLGFPRAGGFYSYLPPAVGDHVMVHFTDYSIDEWWDSGRETEPSFAHSHELTDCYAVPGGYPKPKALSDLNGNDAVIGKEDGSVLVFKANGEIHAGSDDLADSKLVALAELVKNEITALRNTVNTNATMFNTHMHPSGMGPTGTPTTSATSPAAVGDVKCTKLKAE